MTTLGVVIPTFGAESLLERTLTSLAQCNRPPSLREMVVVENGGKFHAESIVQQFTDRLPIRYQYSEEGNKSIALNRVLDTVTADFLILLDDDIRADRDLLVAYANDVNSADGGYYLGGHVNVDYAVPPPEWLKEYLPVSAKGWSLGPQRQPIRGPMALGMNWGAFTKDLRNAGGFDKRFGPGTGSRGQETTMQKRLLRQGVSGFFLPQAIVWHYVPQNRCSPEWAVDRIRQVGKRVGTELREASILGRWRRLSICYFKRALLELQPRRSRQSWADDPARFRREFYRAYYTAIVANAHLSPAENG